jgi:uncharacterized RDD family membrane protein YckC
MSKPLTASFSRRFVAICIDWAGASLISAAFFNYEALVTLAIYAVMQFSLVGTVGQSIGHRLLKLAVVRLDGQRVGFWRAIVRTSLICLVIPALIWDTSDGRGMHDKAVGTAIVKL